MMNTFQDNCKDEENNPFLEEELNTDCQFDLTNDNNNKKDIGKEYINFSINPKEVKQYLKDINEKYNDLESLLNYIIDKHNQISNIYKSNTKFKEMGDKNNLIINNILLLKNNLDNIKETTKDLNNKINN